MFKFHTVCYFIRGVFRVLPEWPDKLHRHDTASIYQTVVTMVRIGAACLLTML